MYRENDLLLSTVYYHRILHLCVYMGDDDPDDLLWSGRKHSRVCVTVSSSNAVAHLCMVNGLWLHLYRYCNTCITMSKLLVFHFIEGSGHVARVRFVCLCCYE